MVWELHVWRTAAPNGQYAADIHGSRYQASRQMFLCDWCLLVSLLFEHCHNCFETLVTMHLLMLKDIVSFRQRIPVHMYTTMSDTHNSPFDLGHCCKQLIKLRFTSIVSFFADPQTPALRSHQDPKHIQAALEAASHVLLQRPTLRLRPRGKSLPTHPLRRARARCYCPGPRLPRPAQPVPRLRRAVPRRRAVPPTSVLATAARRRRRRRSPAASRRPGATR